MKKIYLLMLIIVLAIIAIIATRFIFGGSEDTWICENGEWVKHGVPRAPEPQEGCGDEKKIGGDRDEHGCLGPAGYQWCPSTEKCQRMWEEYCEEYKDQYKGDLDLECISNDPENCPEKCVVCPPCEACSSLSCQTEEFCEKMGIDRSWYEDQKERLKYLDIIKLETPLPEEVITSPLSIKGEARGVWFFEGDFPVVLTNWDGLIIAEGFATAQGDPSHEGGASWMTEDFVSFEAELEFEVDTQVSNKGSLIFKRDNPSGLSENDDALEIPILFFKE